MNDLIGWNTGITACCPVCGKKFYISEPEQWVFKIHTHRGRKHRTMWFDKYSCKRKYDEQYENSVKKARQEGMKKQWANRKRARQCTGKIREEECTGEDGEKHCVECRYMVKDHFGFKTCTTYGYSLNSQKKACNRFRANYETA